MSEGRRVVRQYPIEFKVDAVKRLELVSGDTASVVRCADHHDGSVSR